MGKVLFGRGTFTVSVTFPAVKMDEVRFRFIVNNSHGYQQIDDTVDVLVELGHKHGLLSGAEPGGMLAS